MERCFSKQEWTSTACPNCLGTRTSASRKRCTPRSAASFSQARHLRSAAISHPCSFVRSLYMEKSDQPRIRPLYPELSAWVHDRVCTHYAPMHPNHLFSKKKVE